MWKFFKFFTDKLSIYYVLRFYIKSMLLNNYYVFSITYTIDCKNDVFISKEIIGK